MQVSSLLTPAQAAVLADLHERDRQERLQGIRNDSSLKALAPSVAQLLYLLIIQKGARTVVEFGTSHGYSTIHLAAAADRTDGHVYTVDMLPKKTAAARGNLEAAGLLHRVTLSTCDGADFVASLPHAIDFILIDYGVASFVPTFEALREKTAVGCTLFADGGPRGYWESDAASDFRVRLEADPVFLVQVLPMEKDQLIAVRTA